MTKKPAEKNEAPVREYFLPDSGNVVEATELMEVKPPQTPKQESGDGR